MPTILENKQMWEQQYDWSAAGNEWSATWGGTNTLWFHTLYPRIHAWLPAKTILEIGPGFGRWTQFLVQQCSELILVDLSHECIHACQRRFGGDRRISYYVNDGKSLEFILDQSVDFVFTFDSLVHAEADAIGGYLEEMARVLRPDGVAFVHHSNFAEQQSYLARIAPLPYRLKRLLSRYQLIETLEEQWRARSMSAELYADLAAKAGLQCISQELINWNSRHLIDCISVVTPKDSCWQRDNQVIRNPNFMREATYAASLSHLYEHENC